MVEYDQVWLIVIFIRVSKGTFIFNSFDKNQDGRIYVHNIEAVLQYMVRHEINFLNRNWI